MHLRFAFFPSLEKVGPTFAPLTFPFLILLEKVLSFSGEKMRSLTCADG